MNIKKSLGSWFADLGFGFTTVGLALFVVVLILIIVVDYMTLTQKKVKDYEKTAATTTTSVGTEENKTFSEECGGIDKAGNPLIGEFMRINNRAVGNLIGNVEGISFNQASTSATIDLVSKDGYQHHTITVTDHKGLVADDATKKQLALKNVTFGDAVAVSFECDEKTNNMFTVTQIAIVLHR